MTPSSSGAATLPPERPRRTYSLPPEEPDAPPTGPAVAKPPKLVNVADYVAFCRRLISGEVREVTEGTFVATTGEEERAAALRHTEVREWKGRALMAVARAQHHWTLAGVPPRYFDVDLNDLGSVPAAYSERVEQLRSMMVVPALNGLIGRRGPGKTHLAIALVREFCRHGKAARYTSALGVFRAIRETWGGKTDGRAEVNVISPLEDADLLVIDEIQVRSESAWENNILTDLIDHRYNHMKSTLIIGNLDPKALHASVGDSIASRMVEMGAVLVCDWPTFRKPGRAQPDPDAKLPPVDARVADLIDAARGYRSYH